MNNRQYQNMWGNSVRLPQLLHNRSPSPLPDWLCPTCSMKLISQYWRSTYRRDLQREYSNRQIRSFLADPCLRNMSSSSSSSTSTTTTTTTPLHGYSYGTTTTTTTPLHGYSYGGVGAAWPWKCGGPAVQLGVLEPRVDSNGRPCPQTLDLLGPGKKPLDEGGKGTGTVAAAKAFIDLDPDCAEDHTDGSSSSRKNKKAKIA